MICVCFALSLYVDQAIRSVLWQDVYPQIKLWEFCQVNVDSAVEHFRTLLQNGLYLRSVNSSEVVSNACNTSKTLPYLVVLIKYHSSVLFTNSTLQCSLVIHED